MIEWTDEMIQPAQSRSQISVQALVAELAAQPGRWAEVGRYPHHRRKSAYSRGSQTCKRYPELQYGIRQEGDTHILYFRIPE